MINLFNRRKQNVQTPVEARQQNRFRSGAASTVTSQDGRVQPSVIQNVNSGGMRILTGASLEVGARIKCRVDFSDHSEYVPVRVVWARQIGTAWQYGVRHVPVVPGTLHLLDNYLQKVLLAA
jgi:hypothetical protein